MPYTDPRQPDSQADRGADKQGCVRCKRARWMMTLLMLSAMAVILYLNVSAR